MVSALRNRSKVGRSHPHVNGLDGATESGSISPLILTYFVLILISTFLVMNLGSAYLSRRELTSRVEASLAISAKELDELTYYYGNPIVSALNGLSRTARKVPIDCLAAELRFREEFSRSRTSLSAKRSNPLIRSEILSFRCNGYELFAEVEEEANLPFQLRVFGFNSFHNRVMVGSSTTYLN